MALGYWVDADVLVRVGALMAMTGSFGLATYAVRIWSARARWTTDDGWHAFAIGGLVSAVLWFVIGMGIMAGRAMTLGTALGAWSLRLVLGPLVVGWVGLAILASATHLVPAVGPGTPVIHARQRAMLGAAGLWRVALLDIGTAGISVGLAAGLDPVGQAGAMLLVVGFVWTVALLGRAAFMVTPEARSAR